MTTDLRVLLLSLVAALALACASESMGKRGGLNEAQVAALPMEIQPAYGVFEYKCSRCHTLSRPLNASITSYEHWEAYVARMRKHAGSGISESDAREILRFLRYYADKKAAEKAEGTGS